MREHGENTIIIVSHNDTATRVQLEKTPVWARPDHFTLEELAGTLSGLENKKTPRNENFT